MIPLDPTKPGLKLALGLGAALILAVAIAWLAVSRANLKADLAQAEANVATLQGANRAKAKVLEELRSYATATDKALTQRDKALQEITAQRAALRQQMEEVMRDDPKVRAWADEPLPAAVRQLLP
jgi:LysB family phage lysis regulatory protein